MYLFMFIILELAWSLWLASCKWRLKHSVKDEDDSWSGILLIPKINMSLDCCYNKILTESFLHFLVCNFVI